MELHGFVSLVLLLVQLKHSLVELPLQSTRIIDKLVLFRSHHFYHLFELGVVLIPSFLNAFQRFFSALCPNSI
jgi:hypothetical protein